MRAAFAVTVAALVFSVGAGAALVLGESQATAADTCEQSLSEALQANRIVAPSQSYRKDNPVEYAAVRAYIDGGARPSGSLTHMGLHLVLEEDLCRALGQTTTTTTTTTSTTTTTTTEPPPPPPPPPSGSANVWVDLNGGSCTRSSSPAAYSDAAACATFDQAWDAMQAGDVARVRPGTYPGQNVTGNKTAVTKIIGEPGVVVSGTESGFCSYGPATGLMQVTAAYLWLENVRIDAGNQHGQGTGGCIDAANVTYRNVDLYGAFVSLYPIRPNFTWQGGNLGAPGSVGGIRSCGDGEPIWVEDTADGTVIDGVTFNVQRSSGDSCHHLENIRIQTANDVTVRNVRFVAGSDAGSGHIFITSASGGATVSNLRIENTIFEPVNGTYAIQIHPNVATGQNWVIRSNRFDQPVLNQGTQYVNLVACGNTGQVPASWQTPC